MSISSINSSSSAMMSGGMRGTQRPDPSKMAEDLFSKLDTKGQGYIEKSDLETALSNASQSGSSTSSSSSSVADALFSKLDGDGDGKVTKEEMSATIQKIAAELDGPSPRTRMQGGTPPPPPPQGGGQGAQGASSTSSTTSSQSSDPADTNGDGTVSAIEALAYEISQAASSATDASSSSASDSDAKLMQMLTGNMPPPSNDGQGGPGFTKDQLTSMSKELGSTDSHRSKVMSDIVSNFDAADTDGDGKVNGSEAKAYEDSKSSSGSSTSASSSDAQFMKQMMQLLQSYGSLDQTTEHSSFSASA
ncbi:EF-hand domain-containing protein [Methylobacter sp.]|uniref:EF-hand domain-containing protein n=1 Tax=Methylobacter sp. TaxID=2051955 RepID=UPI002FDC961B